MHALTVIIPRACFRKADVGVSEAHHRRRRRHGPVEQRQVGREGLVQPLQVVCASLWAPAVREHQCNPAPCRSRTGRDIRIRGWEHTEVVKRMVEREYVIVEHVHDVIWLEALEHKHWVLHDADAGDGCQRRRGEIGERHVHCVMVLDAGQCQQGRVEPVRRDPVELGVRAVDYKVVAGVRPEA